MRQPTGRRVRTSRLLLSMALFLALETLPTVPSALAASARQAPDALGTVLLKVQASRALPGHAPFNPANPSFTRIAAGHSPRIVLYAYFSGITTPVTVQVSFSAQRGSKLVFQSGGTFSVGRAQLGGASSGWRWYWSDIGSITKKPGRLTFRGVIHAGGVTQVRETSLTLF